MADAASVRYLGGGEFLGGGDYRGGREGGRGDGGRGRADVGLLVPRP